MPAMGQLLGSPAARSVAGKPSIFSLETHPPSAIEAIISKTTTLDLAGNPPTDATTEKSPLNATPMDTDGKLAMGLTENLSPTFLSTGNPCLDFFFHILPDTPAVQLIMRLELAWAQDPLTTLKLVCNLRGVRGTGKSDKEGFYAAAYWLHKKHPKTLAFNAGTLVEFGYLKDLPEILYRLIEGLDSRKIAKQEWDNKKRAARGTRFKRGGRKKDSEISKEEKEGILENVEEMGCVNFIDKGKARELRKEKEIAKAKRALDKYMNDSDYRLLYDSVCDVFAALLKSDLQLLEKGEMNKISLAAKWCPSTDSSYDKTTLICEGIARRVFPRDCDKDYGNIEEAHYVYRIRDRLRKQVLVPLRKALELPEVYMSANNWNSLPYERVASVAMKTYKELFTEHDQERFDKYLEDVASGKAKIAAGALLPHEIICSLDEKDGEKVAELQWARMVGDLANKGKMKNCIAVSDVSGSMSGTPMEVSVALGLLVSELSEEPWKGKLITFSENPELHVIEGDSLRSKTCFIRTMEWGLNTDFQKVFDQILAVAIAGKVSEDQMIQRIFVFSDMEFDEASGYKDRPEKEKIGRWETDYEVIQKKYHENGYSKVPEIVFWNLRTSKSTPVVAKQPGVALVSGFSKNLLTLFLEEGGIVNPEDVMALAIAGREYQKLAIYD